MSGDRESVLTALGERGRTHQVAKRLGWPTPKARYYLTQLERAGKVRRDERYTSENDIYWIPA
jgi:DNA-binding IclR family transcriptional regulator